MRPNEVVKKASCICWFFVSRSTIPAGGRGLAGSVRVFQVSGRNPPGYLHDECDRIAELPVEESDAEPFGAGERRGHLQNHVSGLAQRGKKMGYAG
jgi:hypothetical protein